MCCILQQTWQHTWTALVTSSSAAPVPMSSIIRDVLQQWLHGAHCRWDNNLPHDLSVEPSSRARMCYHNHLKSCLYSIMQNPEIILGGAKHRFSEPRNRNCQSSVYMLFLGIP